ncbi:MAG TPA: hypothetical protein PLX89_18190 [Verrucomicrobiota bacterium]|nr:hypothetical protein [Verrucomicrobiota bacterium]
MDGLLTLDTDHLDDADARVDEPKIFKEWTTEADIRMLLKLQLRAQTAE